MRTVVFAVVVLCVSQVAEAQIGRARMHPPQRINRPYGPAFVPVMPLRSVTRYQVPYSPPVVQYNYGYVPRYPNYAPL